MYNIILAFITAFLLTFRVIPPIIVLAKKKKLYDEPDNRKSHLEITPRLGGVAIFAGLLFSIILWTPFGYLGDLQYILSAFIIMFLIGAKDDIEMVSPVKKFTAEFFAALILIFKANVRITDFYGILGVHEIPFWASIVFSLFVIIAIINAFNLIDGVDGLAGTTALLVSVVLGYWFFNIDRIELSIVAFAMAGSILGFLYYNYSPAKIFMGDTGSLLLGLVSAILVIKFIEINKEPGNMAFHIKAGPVFALALLVLPVFDTVRVMTLRIMNNKSPFQPDRNHIHHLLLDLGLSHMQVTAILTGVNIIIIAGVYYLRDMDINILLMILVVFVFSLIGILVLIHRKKVKNKKVK